MELCSAKVFIISEDQLDDQLAPGEQFRLSDSEEEEEIEVDLAAARNMAERASERQDLLDARAVAENVNRELANGADAGVQGPPIQPGSRRQAVPGGRGGMYMIPRCTTVTPVAGKENQPSKRRKKAETADAFPESEYPDNYTREQINMMEPADVIKIKEMQMKEKKLTKKEVALPGNLQLLDVI